MLKLLVIVLSVAGLLALLGGSLPRFPRVRSDLRGADRWVFIARIVAPIVFLVCVILGKPVIAIASALLLIVALSIPRRHRNEPTSEPEVSDRP